MNTALPSGWRLSASGFNWTPEVVRAGRTAAAINVGIVADDIASVIEVEAGQLWRSFPTPDVAEIDAFRAALDAVGGSVSIVGVSLDDWGSLTTRRTDAQRLEFLEPQLRAASRLGAEGVRLPIGQAGPHLLALVQPLLHELDLTLFEEIQGQQRPEGAAQAAAIESIAALDDPRIRLLIDISMLMPALPESYLRRLHAGGVSASLIELLSSDWRSPDTHDAVLGQLRSGAVPGPVHTLFMNLIIRFGRSNPEELRSILPLTGAIHLKFWDLDDTDGRLTAPMSSLATELVAAGFTGTLCSEWGGHEWLDDDPAEMTRSHLALARAALGEGAAR